MILDRLSNAEQYFALHPDFPAAFAFLRRVDLAEFPLGKHIIDGDRLFVIFDRPTGKGQAAARLEAHRQYIDIQLCLRGNERIGWRPRCDCHQVTQPYDAQKDIEFFGEASESWLELPHGTFAVFFPDDAHAPLAGEGDMFKAVVKVAIRPS